MALFHPHTVTEPTALDTTLDLHEHQDGDVRSHIKFANVGEAWAAIPGVFASHPWCGKITLLDVHGRARYDVERVEG